MWPTTFSTRTVPFACHEALGFDPTTAASATDAIASMATLTPSRTTPRIPVLLTPASCFVSSRNAPLYERHPTPGSESVNLWVTERFAPRRSSRVPQAPMCRRYGFQVHRGPRLACDGRAHPPARLRRPVRPRRRCHPPDPRRLRGERRARRGGARGRFA